MDRLLPGIRAERVPTGRLAVNVLSVPGRTGLIGAIPGWPGEQAWPPQPMLAQTRAVLDGYAAAGGHYREVAVADSGHGPHLDQAERFLAELCDQLERA
jgi:hypothetical protein